MGACSTKGQVSEVNEKRPRNRVSGDGVDKTFRLGDKANKAEVINQSSHAIEGLGEGQGDKVAFNHPNDAEKDARRKSMTVPRNFFLSLNVPYNDITFDLKMGSGTFGQVFKAHIGGKRCAVKEMFLNGSAQERLEILADFGKECKIMSLMMHPNIVQFWGSVQEAPHFCIITELCEGSVVDLLSLVAQEKINVTWKLLLGITSGGAEALKYLHYDCATQIIHRDVKAENLLLNKRFVCKLTDFGLSRVIEAGLDSQNKNMTMCGTPSWVAPEIFKGEPYNNKIDVYSFGVVMWELYCFRKPYMKEDPVKLPYKVALQNLRPPLSPHIPEFLAKLMCQCWDGDPAKRPSFIELTEKLQGANKYLGSVSLEEPVDITKVNNNLYKVKKEEAREARKTMIPGMVPEGAEGGDEGEAEASEGGEVANANVLV
mmetsp:Transcript_11483/g.23514  ORF Transcript_11483/g.23514 Transcript_11483/m.23514 type:complete len:429 (+) Transcript_11483:194-1480(+)